MNELQKIEYELLKQFIDISEKLGVTYYLVCGSALGAVKYNGFIPWDDDVDVALPRADYERFISEAQKYLPEHIFLQNYQTDPSFTHIYSKLRASNTTYIEKAVAHLPINHGVYIDVFPLDGYPKRKFDKMNMEMQKKVYQLQISCVYKFKRSLKGKILYKVGRVLGWHKRTAIILKKYNTCISKFPCNRAEIICNHGNWQGKLEYAPKEQYGEGAWAMFEGLRVRVPEKYDEYLTQKYGDWRADPPESEKVGHHYYSVMDLHKPYTEYISKGE